MNMKHPIVSVLVTALSAACGEVADPNKPADAPLQQDGPDADVPIDAPPPRCDPSKPFGTPVAITELNATGANDTAASLTPDELTITFGSNRSGGPGSVDAYIATRASTSDPWSAPSLINGVNTSGVDGRPHLTADGLTIYLEYQVNVNGSYDIVSSTRATTSAAFTAPSPVTPVNTTISDTAPYVLPDHSAMYLVNSRMLHRAARTGTTWGPPVVVTGTNLQAGDFDYPVVTPDELTLYFGSTRGGQTYDIFVATRTSVVNGFDAPTRVAELSGGTAETPGWISPDNCVIYFAREVGGGAVADYDLFRAVKPL